MDMDKLMDQIMEFAMQYGPKLIGAIFVWFIGLWVIKKIASGFAKFLDKGNLDPSLKPFLKSLVDISLKVLLVITVLGMLGVQMSSFVAIIGAAGLAVGLALQGTLQNFAGGVVILIFKPFKVGDFINAQGYSGTVYEIQIFNTILKTGDNKNIIVPNGALSNSSMTNFSAEKTRRVEWTMGIAYGDDLLHAEKVIKQLCDQDSRILKDPEVFIAVSELADSSVNFVVRAWVNAADYWPVFFDMNKNVYLTFPKEGLNIPFPQMDVHISKD